MKTAERHRLKANEVATTLGQARDLLQERTRLVGLVTLAVVLLAAAGAGYWFWRKSRQDAASSLYAQARATATAPVVPPTIETPGTTPPAPPAGSYPTEAARNEAALKRYQEVAAAYPSTAPGRAATYQAASLLASIGKLSEAEQLFGELVREDANGLHGRMARLGVAAIQVSTSRFDPAIQTFTELAQRTDGDLPVDGILMQLAQAYERAGKVPDAIRVYERVTTEFTESPYASDARADADRLKAGVPRAASDR